MLKVNTNCTTINIIISRYPKNSLRSKIIVLNKTIQIAIEAITEIGINLLDHANLKYNVRSFLARIEHQYFDQLKLDLCLLVHQPFQFDH